MGVIVRQNKRLTSLKLNRTKEVIDETMTEKAYDIANTLVALSPVWSGAYVTSHSFVPAGSGGGRSRISRRDQGPVDPAMAKNEALSLLAADIAAVDFGEVRGGTFRNRAPHATAVEYTGTPREPGGYFVYARTIDIHR